MTSNNAQSASTTAPELQERVNERFGVLPNFFRLSSETPEITERLWGFAQAAYLDNPLPSVFKERLFVYLSRFCAVRYCIARHTGFLIGLGRPAGDKNACAQSVADVVKLLRRPLARGPELQSRLSFWSKSPVPLVEMPTADTQMEDGLFSLASHVFLQTAEATGCLDALERLLGTVRLQYLLLFLAFVRAAHYWTRVHPEIQFEDDIKQLLATHEALASCIIIDDPEAITDKITQSILDELPELRQKADKAIGLLASIVDSSDDAIVSKTLEGVITSWNAGAERLFGYTAKEAIGQHISMIIPIDRWDEETKILARLRQGERIDHFETVRLRKDGKAIDMSVTISPVKDAAGRVVGASKVGRDISERKRTEARIQELHEDLELRVGERTAELEGKNRELLKQTDVVRDLSGRLLQIQDEERRRIARELHDSAGQLLAAINMNISKVAREKEKLSTGAGRSVEEAADLIQQALVEIRTMSHLLHPPLLDEVGLESAIRGFIEGFAQRSKIDVNLIVTPGFERLSPDLEITIFRVVQECLTNVHRHSESRKAEVRLARRHGCIHLEVSDEGKGIPLDKQLDLNSPATLGVGFRGMRERIRQLGGTLQVHSNGNGTSVEATLPVEQGRTQQGNL
jgi:two-component system sensor histidine kinase UhpB